jgi:hypothetical protein
MSNASVSKDCFCSNTKILANNYNAIPPRAPTFANTLISGTQPIIKSETQSKPIKEDPITNETATPPGSGRSRVPGEVYFPPRGINHYRKTLQCPFPDVFNCNPNANVVEVYKDPYALCEPEYRYDKVIKARNNSKGGNMDLYGNILKEQTIPNQYYSISYQGYLNYKKCKFPISKEDAIKPNIFSIKLIIERIPFGQPTNNITQVTVTIPLNNDSNSRGLVFQPDTKVTFINSVTNYSVDAIIKNVTFTADNKPIITLKNPVSLVGASDPLDYYIVLSGNPLVKAENATYNAFESNYDEKITSIKYITNNYPDANLRVGGSYKIIYDILITYNGGITARFITVFEFTIKTLTVNNQFTVIEFTVPIYIQRGNNTFIDSAVLSQISFENIITQSKCYTVVSNNPSYCGNLVTYNGATYPNRTFRDVAAVDSSAQVARRRYKNISNSITKSPNKDFGISKCGNYIGGGQAEYKNIQKKSTICNEAYTLSKIRQNNKFICPPIIKEESKVKKIIETGVVVCIGIPGRDNESIQREFSTGTDNLNGSINNSNVCVSQAAAASFLLRCITPRPIEFWKDFFSQYGDNLFTIDFLEIKGVNKGENTSDILNEIFGERLYAINGPFIYNVTYDPGFPSEFKLTNEFSTLIEFKNLVSVKDFVIIGNNYGDFKGIVFDKLIEMKTFSFGSFGTLATTPYINNTTTPILFSFESLKQIFCNVELKILFYTTITEPVIISKGVILNIPNVIFIGENLHLGIQVVENTGLDIPFFQLINKKIKNIYGNLIIDNLVKTNSNPVGVIEFPALEEIGTEEQRFDSRGNVILAGSLQSFTIASGNPLVTITEFLFPELKAIYQEFAVGQQAKLTKMRFPKLEILESISFTDNTLFSFNEPTMRISMPSMNNTCIPGSYIVTNNAENVKVYPAPCFNLYVIGGISYDKNTNSVNLNASNNNISNIYKINFNLVSNTFEIETAFQYISNQELNFISKGLFYHNVVSFPETGTRDRSIIISGGLYCLEPPFSEIISGVLNPKIECYAGCYKTYEDPTQCYPYYVNSTIQSASLTTRYVYVGTSIDFNKTPRVGSKAIISTTYVYFFGGGNYNTSTASGLDLLTNNNGTLPTFDENIIRYKKDEYYKDGSYNGKMDFLSSVPGFTTNEMWNFGISITTIGEAMIIGGVIYNSTTKVYTTLNTIAKYNFTAKSWTAEKVLNRQREHPMCVFDDSTDTHYVIGGKDRNASVQILSNLEISTDDGASWTLRQDVPLNVARCNAVCEIVGTYIYVIGGEGEAPNYSLDSIERLNLNNIDAGWELLEQKFPYDFTGGAGILLSS